ncbi:MAG: c-type cytochrome [Actinomycetota bacterium]|nr:c-type cytochrome [Actinomycetota bacterium]
MEELIKKAAEARGLPAAMVERSAAARAKAEGTSVEAVLREWAGEEAAAEPEPAGDAATPTPTAEGDAAAEGEAAEEAPAAGGPEEAAQPKTGPKVEVLSPQTSDAAADPATAEDATGAESPEPDTAPEPVAPSVPLGSPALAGFPRWLAAAFLVIPTIAVLYALLAPDGPGCGTSGQLAIDPVTGEAANCDGSAPGEESTDFFTLGGEVYTARCAVCHGANGGGGVGPPLAGEAVVATFPGGSCATDDGHIAWVALGTGGWPDPTYGAIAKPVGGAGVMPAFGELLSEEELGAVVLYERVNFGGMALAEVETDCALTEEEGVTAAPIP